jgi:hypothetical protein
MNMTSAWKLICFPTHLTPLGSCGATRHRSRRSCHKPQNWCIRRSTRRPQLQSLRLPRRLQLWDDREGYYAGKYLHS